MGVFLLDIFKINDIIFAMNIEEKKSILDYKKLIKRLWLILWAILGILLVLKYCFNMWYPIVLNNDKLYGIFNWIDAHRTIEYFINLVFYEVNVAFTYLTTIKSKRFKDWNLVAVLIIGFVANLIKWFNTFLGFIPELLALVIYPIIYNLRCKNLKSTFWNVAFPIVINLLFMMWQLNILFIRGVNDVLTNAPSFVSIIMMFDYYIFIIITWMGVNYMGTIGIWFFSKKQLEAMKQKELAKANPDMDYVAQIDAELAKRK